METWKSKLGTVYPKHEIEGNQTKIMSRLTKLRQSVHNKFCADCGKRGTVWCSVNLGVFTCMKCGIFHRALGTHISVPKGCTGTYLWGPDELARMESLGNDKTKSVYTADAHRPRSNASDAEWLEYLREKYERKRWITETRQTETSCGQNKPVKGGNISSQNCVSRVDLALNSTEIDLLEDWKSLTDYREHRRKATTSKDVDFFEQFGL